MRYKKFTISNYKGISSIELDLSKKPNLNIFTLVGLNESGKTSILEAIDLFQNGIEKDDAHTLIPKSQQFGFTGKIFVEAELQFEPNDKDAVEKYLEEQHNFIVSEFGEVLKIKKQYSFEKSIPLESGDWYKLEWSIAIYGKTKRAQQEKRLWDWKKEAWRGVVDLIQGEHLPKILYYPDFLFEFPEKIYLKQFDGESAEQEIYRGVVQDILSSIQPGLTIEDALLTRMERQNVKAQSNALKQLLIQMSTKLNKEILRGWNSIFAKERQKKEVIVSEGVDKGSENQHRYYIELKIRQGSADSSIKKDMALGFRWFFSFLIFIAFRKSRRSDPGETLFLLDEPASNLHQRSQQKLLNSLEKIVPNCKLIYSTHSHHLINPRWLAGTYIIQNKAMDYKNPEDSEIRETNIVAILYKNFVAEHPREEDHFRPILDSLEYAPSYLEMTTPLVFTEGKNDYYTFKYIAETIFNNQYELKFYPGAGVDKYDNIFRRETALGKHFVAIFDADNQGIRALKNYNKNIGVDVKDKIFTLQNINAKWDEFKTEDLFSSEPEKIRIIQVAYPDHNREEGFVKSKFNTAIQELYINKRKINLNKQTRKNFKQVLNFMNNKLSGKPK